MSVEYIRNYETKEILGIVETAQNGDQTAREYPSRRILGYYRVAKNQTTDVFGRVLSTGNTVTSLIYKEKQN